MNSKVVEEKLFKVSVDPVIFSINDGKIQVLLIKRDGLVYNGFLALPGGLLEDSDSSIELGLNRVLEKKTGVSINYMEQLLTRTGHDPRGPTVSIAYIALVDKQSTLDVAKWIDVEEALRLRLAFDHSDVIEKALSRLTNKVNYSTLPMHFLEKKFTLPKLQKVYEIILGEKLDKSTFRKKIEETELLIDTGEIIKDGAHRPSKLYSIAGEQNIHHFTKNILK